MPQVEVPVNYVAVLVCAIVAMIIGSLWYGPVFGKQWMALMGITKEQLEKGKKANMTKQYIFLFISTLVMAFVLSHMLVFASAYMHETGTSAGLMTGFWNWLGFIAPVTLGSVLWERRPWTLWVLNNAYQLLTLCVMGVILANWVA